MKSDNLLSRMAAIPATHIIQVTNVAPAATVEQMKELFGYLGKIRDIKLYPSDNYIIEPQSKVCYVQYHEAWSVGVAQHLTNTVFIDRALIVVPIADDGIPSEATALALTNPTSALPGLVSSGPNPLINEISGVDGNLVITTIDPKLTALGLPQYPPLPANMDPAKIEEIRRTVYVGNLDSTVTADHLLKFVNQIGEVKYVRMAGDETQPTRFAFVEFTDQSSVAKALQYNGVLFERRPLKINHSNNAIVKPQPKSSETAQKEIDEAMKRVREAQSLITAAIEPELADKEKKRSRRSRSRSRSHRRSSSRSRRKKRSRSRSKRSRSRHRSSSRVRSRSRRRSRTPTKRAKRDKSRSRSRDKRKSTLSPRHRKGKSRSHSRDRSKKHHRTRSRSRSSGRSNSKSKSRKSSSSKEIIKVDKSKNKEKSPKREKSLKRESVDKRDEVENTSMDANVANEDYGPPVLTPEVPISSMQSPRSSESGRIDVYHKMDIEGSDVVSSSPIVSTVENSVDESVLKTNVETLKTEDLLSIIENISGKSHIYGHGTSEVIDKSPVDAESYVSEAAIKDNPEGILKSGLAWLGEGAETVSSVNAYPEKANDICIENLEVSEGSHMESVNCRIGNADHNKSSEVLSTSAETDLNAIIMNVQHKDNEADQSSNTVPQTSKTDVRCIDIVISENMLSSSAVDTPDNRLNIAAVQGPLSILTKEKKESSKSPIRSRRKDKHSRSPSESSSSPEKTTKYGRTHSRSPSKEESVSPRKRKSRSISKRRSRSRSHKRSRSRSKLSRRKSRSPSVRRRRSRSPVRRRRSRSTARSSKRTSCSPRRRSRSPRRKSPKRRSGSSRKRSITPKRRSRTPRRRSRTPHRRSITPKRRSRSPSYRRRSRSSRRSRSPVFSRSGRSVRRSRSPRKRSPSLSPSESRSRKRRDKREDSLESETRRKVRSDTESSSKESKVLRNYDEEEKGYDNIEKGIKMKENEERIESFTVKNEDSYASGCNSGDMDLDSD